MKPYTSIVSKDIIIFLDLVELFKRCQWCLQIQLMKKGKTLKNIWQVHPCSLPLKERYRVTAEWWHISIISLYIFNISMGK